jgi:CubicO group peptidase (beta-lactamase class C family)
MLLTQPPEVKPGTEYLYSNAGYSVAGAAAERITDTDWEELMEQRLFHPLGMKTAGFGAMGEPDKIDQPWPHRAENTGALPIPPGPMSDNPPALGPAGRVHCSIGDWAKFILAHIKGANGEKSLLAPESFGILHTPAFEGDYACGWIATERPWGGGRVLTHAGSNTMNYAVVWMAPERDFAALAATNHGGDAAHAACDEAAGALIRRYLTGE